MTITMTIATASATAVAVAVATMLVLLLRLVLVFKQRQTPKLGSCTGIARKFRVSGVKVDEARSRPPPMDIVGRHS